MLVVAPFLLILACVPGSGKGGFDFGGIAEVPCVAAAEICDGVDNDCDGLTDDADPERTGAPAWYRDADGDGYGAPSLADLACLPPTGWVSDSSDCDDSDPTISPASREVCEDGIDQDCSGGDARCSVEDTGGDTDTGSDTDTGGGDDTGGGVDGADVVLGDSTDNLFAVGGLGDESGDGIADVWTEVLDSDTEARVFVFAGALGGPLDSPVGMVRGPPYMQAAGVGDMDGDGVGDVIVGSYQDNALAGGVYLLTGPVVGVTSLSSAVAIFSGEAEHDLAGLAIAAVGDVDGDSGMDVLVGAYGNDNAAEDAGAAYLLTGRLSGAVTDPTATFTGETTEDWFGIALGGQGDVDGDGLSDVLVNASWADDGSHGGAGATYVFTGGLSGSVPASEASLRIAGAHAWDASGQRIAYAGDLSGDGLDDILVLRGDQVVGVYFGGRTGEQTDAETDGSFTGDGRDAFGSGGFASGRDLNGDGVADLGISAGAYHPKIDTWGRAYLFYGPFSGARSYADADGVIEGDEGHLDMGRAVAAVGDVSGDGLDDLMVGDVGQAFIFLGPGP